MGFVSKIDGWINAVTGLGTVRDKTTSARFVGKDPELPTTLENLFNDDDLAAIICEEPAEQMLRRGFVVQVPSDMDAGTAITMKLQDLKTSQRFADALVWEAVFGGSAILVGVDDGQKFDQPLDMERIRSVDHLTVFDRTELVALRYYEDPGAAKYGSPSHYLISSTGSSKNGSVVHESRLILFEGGRVTRRERRRRQGWGISRLERSMESIKRFDLNWQSVTNLIQDASQAVFRLKGLVHAISQGNEKLIEKRMGILDMSRSVARAIVLDADSESFERKDTNLSGLQGLISENSTRFAASARMPVSVIFGKGASGLSATGDGDERVYYDKLDGYRDQDLRPQIERLIRMIMRSANGPTGGVEPPAWSVVFPQLRQKTDSEDAQLKLAHAQADQIRIATGQFSPAQIVKGRYRPEGYSNDLVLEDVDDLEMDPIDDEPSDIELERDDPTPDATTPEANVQQAALNGAQIASLLQVIADIAARRIPRETGLEIITASFPIERAAADKMVGEVGRSFFVSAPDAGAPSVGAGA